MNKQIETSIEWLDAFIRFHAKDKEIEQIMLGNLDVLKNAMK